MMQIWNPWHGCRKYFEGCDLYYLDAQRSGLSYPSGNTDIPMQPKCRFCKRKNNCNGCHWCGKCG